MKSKFFNLFIFLIIGTIVSCDDDESDIKPEACFTIASNENKAGEAVQFTNCSKNATMFVWDFGDGETSIEKQPSHIYAQQGSYNVTLLAGEDTNTDGVLSQLDNPSSVSNSIEVDPNRLSIDLTILDATSWSQSNASLDVVVDANVNLFVSQASADAGKADLTLKSDNNGKAKIYDLVAGTYYLSVDKGDLSNSKDGFLIAGVFQSQEDVDNSPFQSGAAVGGIKYMDLNGDFVLNDDDKSQFILITVKNDETYTKEIVIGK
ncbi:PKD domain-containing protein [Fulvivirgaceae bacterium BMA12]|uniref:PKD domain-containing protein n=1 Tax=Agaribacillus aureus TaxID=3051825 RepID=A0ABT8L7S0_9BACT|nr:PKD domain-containing protein [Fulvivirgaceae bacterium BMA12]